jgi:hypothetical protein
MSSRNVEDELTFVSKLAPIGGARDFKWRL